ncbi:MAG: flagellin [Pirellulaceae bacterium]|jgi:flagellin
MTRINTNVSSLVAQNNLGRTNNQLQESLTRLSTGLRINAGSDDPAGLIASETLRRDITAIGKAITNSERAGQLISTADSALGQVSNLLNDIRGLVTEAANEGALSDEQIGANQLQIDASLTAIDRISQVTSFQGRQVLDGSFDFIVDANPATVEDLQINEATLNDSDVRTVDVVINAAAEQAQLTVGGAGTPLVGDLVFQLSGETGSEAFTFDAGATLDQIVDAVNLATDTTGVTATNNAGVLELDSVGYGEDAFVAVDVISEDTGGGGLFGANLSALRDEGVDIDAIINGVQANGDGNTLSINTSTLSISITVSDGDSTALNFDITGGGAKFQLGGDVVRSQQARLGIQSVNTANLGGASGRLYELRTGGAKALDTDTSGAANVVDEVITKVATIRGRLGAFKATTLGSNIVSLQDSLANLTDAESSIRDADFASETAALTRSQILVQSGLSVLGIANSNPQNALSLLR